jgi:hypothetical protein
MAPRLPHRARIRLGRAIEVDELGNLMALQVSQLCTELTGN